MNARAAAAPKPGGISAAMGVDRSSGGRIATLSVLGLLSFILLIGWDDLASLYIAPLLIGIALGLASKTRFEALVSALMSSLAGSIIAIFVYRQAFQLAAFQLVPDWINRDVTSGIYKDIVIPLVKGSPFMTVDVIGGSPLPLVAVVVLFMTAGAFLANQLHRAEFPKWTRRAAAWAVILVLALSLVYGLGSKHSYTLGGMRDTTNAAIPYQSDPLVNVRTYFFMADGQSFYSAYVKAHELDSRKIAKVKDGKFVGGSATMMRQPAMFYFWQVIAPGGRVELILWVAYLAAALVIAGAYWSLSAMLGYRALFVCFIAFPALLMHAGGDNPLFSEWWALLALLGGFFALVRGHDVTAGVFGLVAVLFRETFGVWLLSLGLATAVFALRDPRMWRRVALYAGLLAAGVAAYFAHVAAGSRYVVSQASGSLGAYLTSASARDMGIRLFSTVSYLMYPYGFFRFSAMWFLPVGIVGLWVGLRDAPRARLTATVYAVLFCGYLIAFGAPSQYWGQAVMPLLIIGTGMLLASLDALGQRSAWRLRLTPADADATLGPKRRPSEETS